MDLILCIETWNELMCFCIRIKRRNWEILMCQKFYMRLWVIHKLGRLIMHLLKYGMTSRMILSSDIWSLGWVLYETACLRPPFKARDMDALYKRVCKGQYPSLPHCYSKSLNIIIQSMLQLNPAKRPSCEKLLNSNIIQK